VHGAREECVEHEELYWLAVAVLAAIGIALTLLIGTSSSISAAFLLGIALVTLLRFAYLAVKRRFSVDLLMSVAGFVTWYLGHTLEGLVIYVLYALSELAEHRAEEYAKRRLKGLKTLLPQSVLIDAGRRVVEVPLDGVKPGMVAVLRRGDVVPADGILLNDATIDTSYITGESEPRHMRKGSRVESGYINVGDTTKMLIVKPPKDSTMQLLVREAEKALERKSRIQGMIERAAPYYTVLVLGVYGTASLALGPYDSLPLLLAGCPSAFIVSASFSTAMAIALLAHRSIVVRGGVMLEKLSSITVAVLDKTGTLTLGKLRVALAKPLQHVIDVRRVLELASAAAHSSRHPASQALAVYGTALPEKSREIPGKGVEVWTNGVVIRVGSKSFIGLAKDADNEPSCPPGLRELYIAVNGEPALLLCLEEELSPSSRQVVNELKHIGLRVILASGDSRDRVEKVAKAANADEFYAELRPEDKTGLVEKLRSRGEKVLMVGDGINDLGALAHADVGVAIGELDAVSGIADAVLTQGIEDLPLLIRAAKTFYRSLIAGFACAAILKAIAMATGLIGAIPMWLVVALGDDGATLAALMLQLLLLSSLRRGAIREFVRVPTHQ